MDYLNKVSSWQLYKFWKNVLLALLILVGIMTFSKLLPPFCSPIIALLCAAVLYTYLFNERTRNSGGCLLIMYDIFLSILVYAFASIILNLIFLWKVAFIPPELVFFYHPYVPSLLMMPVCFIVTLYLSIRKSSLALCRECNLQRGFPYERGKFGSIMSYESHFQLRNLLWLFGLLSAIIWVYYLVFYVEINTNERDWYVFTWLTVIAFIIDELYFAFRYYNLYLDLKENDEIITPDELNDMTAVTYVRFYVICGDYIYLDPNAFDPREKTGNVIDTPFSTRRSMNGVMADDVIRTVNRMTGENDGELRFFYGHRIGDLPKHSLIRYFYFLDGKPEDYKQLRTAGEWMPFSLLKQVYSHTPRALSSVLVGDITRMATIILTQKIFDERGMRKLKIRSYRPSFDLLDLRASNLDFQDDKWIRISMFNSDTRLFRLKKWWRNISGRDSTPTSGTW